ncbi:MAG: DNA methyltransferase [Armatimonadota bacterium]|nr:DNA methyltransferase [Armatimonadota bacterium]
MPSASAFHSSDPVHSPNRNKVNVEDRAFHDWYRFVLSFPPHLVRHYLDSFAPAANTSVLDPFCGTGTTLVEAMKMGLDVVGIEANPIAHLATAAKTNWHVDPSRLEKETAVVAQRAIATLESEGYPEPLSDKKSRERNLFGLRDLDAEAESLLLKGSISPLPLHRVLTLIEMLPTDSQPISNIQRLAMAKALVGPVGNLHFGPEVGVQRTKRLDAPVTSIWLKNVTQSANDLADVVGQHVPQSQVYLADSRNAIDQMSDRSIGALFTSPPYPNEKDYTRTTRLETVLLGLIKTKAELRKLKEALLRSNTRNMYISDTDHKIGLRHPRITSLCNEIEDRRKELGKTSGFERLYSKVTAAYFGGMERHLESLKRVLIPGAKLGYVVGDQASYFRIKINTGEILAEVAESIGYRVSAVDIFRTRLSTATKEQLREEVVVLEWHP